jgi:hypothetical protein
MPSSKLVNEIGAGPIHPPAARRRALFWLYARWYTRRHFHALRVANVDRIPRQASSLILFANHASWWDPLVALLLAEALLPEREHYVPMDVTALDHYAIVRPLGFFPVANGTRRGAAQLLHMGQQVLTRPGSALWITPESRFQDVRSQPIVFRSGLGSLALKRMLTELHSDSTGMVTGFPRQQTQTWLEWLLIQLIHFVLLGFLPLPGERFTRRPGFAVGCDQFMMVRRSSYLATGGHSAIRSTCTTACCCRSSFAVTAPRLMSLTSPPTPSAACTAMQAKSGADSAKTLPRGHRRPFAHLRLHIAALLRSGVAVAARAPDAADRRSSRLPSVPDCAGDGLHRSRGLSRPLPAGLAQHAAASCWSFGYVGVAMERTCQEAIRKVRNLETAKLFGWITRFPGTKLS